MKNNKLSFQCFQGNNAARPILIRIGDFMAYMIIASYYKIIKKKYITFYHCSKIHQQFRADILFKNLFDEIKVNQLPKKKRKNI